MSLPHSPSLPVQLLSQSFNDTSATYKFYWFLSLLQEAEKGNFSPSKKDLFYGMVSNAWYTVNYFHVSFGKQDKLQRAILGIKEQEGLCLDDSVSKVFKHHAESDSRNTVRELKRSNEGSLSFLLQLKERSAGMRFHIRS